MEILLVYESYKNAESLIGFGKRIEGGKAVI